MSKEDKKQEKPKPANFQLVTEAEAAKRIDVCKSKLAKATREGPRKGHIPPLPYYKLGRSIRYSLEDLAEWAAKYRNEHQELADFERSF